MTLGQKPKKRKTPLILGILLIFTIGIGGAVAYFVLFENEKPAITLASQIDYVGTTASLELNTTDRKCGLQNISITLTQGDKTKILTSIDFPRKGYWLHAGPETKNVTHTFSPKKLGFKDGDAELAIIVSDFSFRGLLKGNKSELKKTIHIDTKPPKINIVHSERYIKPGGTGFVIYRLSDDVIKHGVIIGEKLHPGFPIEDGREDVFNALFAIPYNDTRLDNPHIVAEDKAGNRAIAPFFTKLSRAKQKMDRINISDSFLQSKIPEFEQHYPEMHGDLVNKYLYANNTIRRLNNDIIKSVCQKTNPKRLWKDRFLRMSGSSRASFADHRTYFYKDKAIDKQVHLGMDIASTKRIGVKAAGTGRVVYADYLGIYGNTIIIDHGIGLFSLYAHMSQFNSAVDDMVEQGSTIGYTGTTGMAGGDHLHFSILVNGIFVTPIEWWDQNWIDTTIQEPIIDSKF